MSTVEWLNSKWSNCQRISETRPGKTATQNSVPFRDFDSLSVSFWCSMFQASPPPPHPQQYKKQRTALLLNTVLFPAIFSKPLAQLVICLKMHRIYPLKQDCDSNFHYILAKELWHAPSLRRLVGLRLDQRVAGCLCEHKGLSWDQGWVDPEGGAAHWAPHKVGGALVLGKNGIETEAVKPWLLPSFSSSFYSKFGICPYLFYFTSETQLESIFVLCTQLYYIPSPRI